MLESHAACGSLIPGSTSLASSVARRCRFDWAVLLPQSWKSALVCIGNMRKGGVSPGTPAYNVAIRACAMAGEADRVSALLADMRASGAMPDEATSAAARLTGSGDNASAKSPSATISVEAASSRRVDPAGSVGKAGGSRPAAGANAAAAYDVCAKGKGNSGWSGGWQASGSRSWANVSYRPVVPEVEAMGEDHEIYGFCGSGMSGDVKSAAVESRWGRD